MKSEETIYCRPLYEESLAIQRELGEKPGIVECLDAIAELARKEQQERRAAQLWGAATALREGIGVPRLPGDQEQFDREVAAVCSAVGHATFDVAFAEGRALTLEEAVEYALGGVDRDNARHPSIYVGVKEGICHRI